MASKDQSRIAEHSKDAADAKRRDGLSADPNRREHADTHAETDKKSDKPELKDNLTHHDRPIVNPAKR